MLNKVIYKSIFKSIFYIAVLIAFCIMIAVSLFAFFALIISKTDFSYDVLNMVTSAILAISSFICGFSISRWFKENGLICGIFAAVTLSLFICGLLLYFSVFNFTGLLFIKLSIILISGCAGGIIGVNTN